MLNFLKIRKTFLLPGLIGKKSGRTILEAIISPVFGNFNFWNGKECVHRYHCRCVFVAP